MVAGPAWDDDVASGRADENLTKLATDIPSKSGQFRELPNAIMPREWHRAMVDGVEVPDDAYQGGFRGDDHPALTDYEVEVGGLSVTRACDVAEEIRKLISDLRDRVTWLDKLGSQGDPDILAPKFVEEVLDAAAWLHCEWVRIHPFVNGNGRTARMWVLWLCGRYGLPQLLTLRPRPDMGYNAVTQLGITGEYSLFLQYLLARYNAVSTN